MTILWQGTFSNAAYPDVDNGSPTGRSGVNWECSDYFHDNGNLPGHNGDSSEVVVGPYAGDFSSTIADPSDGLWHPTGDDRIYDQANYSGGLGGKGFRHYRSNAGTGANDGGGGVGIDWDPLTPTEVWFRFYMRYQLGFTWGPSGVADPGYDKCIRSISANGMTFGLYGADGSGDRSFGFADTVAGDIGSDMSWQTLMGGLTGDGLFHCFEFHWTAGTNGHQEMWIDNVQVMDTTVTVSTDPINVLKIGGNQNAIGDSNGLSVDNGGTLTDWYTDFDDFVINDTGRIGPIASSITADPVGSLPARSPRRRMQTLQSRAWNFKNGLYVPAFA